METLNAAGGYGPPGGSGGWGPPGGGYGAPPGGGYGAPPGGGYGSPPGGGGPSGFGPPGGFVPPGGPMMPGAGGDVNTTTPLILNIVGALLCSGTCISAIVCIVGIVFAVQAGNLKNTGDIPSARAKAKSSMTMFIVSMVIGVIGYAVIGILRAS